MARWEPSDGMVQAVEGELNSQMHYPGGGRIVRWFLRRQREREAGLLAFIRHISRLPDVAIARSLRADAYQVIAAHEALDAPKVPTLLEAADALVRSANSKQSTFAAVDISAYQALKAAVEREEKR